MNQQFSLQAPTSASNTNMMMFPTGSSSAPVNEENKNQRPLNAAGDSLFRMAMYDVASQNNTIPAHPQQAPAADSSQFYPVEEYRDLSLRQILDLSEECLFSEDEDATSATPLPAHQSAMAPTPLLSKDDIEWNQLQDDWGLDMNMNMDIPCAAALVNSMEDPAAKLASSNPRKRTREVTPSTSTSSEEPNADNNEDRFRPYQSGQWSEKFEELCEYRKTHGHCLVPHTYHQNLPLARWVKRQRYQFKLMKEGKSSTMTEERVTALEDIGFVWDSQGAAWSERHEELRSYASHYGHCNVPSNYGENPQLATWVKCQRRQYKLFQEGKPSNMTVQRIQELNALGFEWELRTYKKARVC